MCWRADLPFGRHPAPRLQLLTPFGACCLPVETLPILLDKVTTEVWTLLLRFLMVVVLLRWWRRCFDGGGALQ